MLCKKCEAELPENANFCPVCGKPTKEEKKKSKRTRANGTGCVYKRGKSWYVVISTGTYPNGNKRRSSKGGFKTKKDAILYLENSRFEIKKDKKISALYEAIQPHILKLSKNKQTHYKTAYDRLQPLQNVNISEITVAALQSTVDNAVATYYPAKDMRDLLSLLYQQAQKDDYIAINKARFIVLPDLEETDTVPFTAEEISSLWTDYQSGHKETGFFLLMIYTGMMPGEARKVTAAMVQIGEKRIIGAGLKTAKRKTTPIILPDIIVPVVQNLIEGKAGDDRLWETDEHSFYEYFAEMKTRTGCRQIKQLRPYSCRHTTATTLADQNVSSAIIKEVMRHSKLSSTQRYIHQDQAAYAEAVNDAFGKNTE